MLKNRQLFSSKRLVMIITTTVFSFSSLTTAFFLMGMKALPYFIWAAVFYFIPYALIISEFTSVYKNDSGGLYQWLSDCLSERTAFIAAFLWYCSYFVWMISLFMKLWIPLSLLLFGEDLTKQQSPIPFLSTTQLIGVLSIFAVGLTLFVVNKGFKQIAHLLYASSVLMFLLVFISFGSNLILWLTHPGEILPHLTSSIHSASAITGDNTFVSQLSFLIFAVTAFGGLDTIASLVDKTGQQKNKFSKLVVFGSFLIVICYFVGLLLWSGALNWQELQADQSLHLGNLMYALMNDSGQRLAASLGGSAEMIQFIGQLFTRLTALTLLISYIALLSSIFYLPLRVLVEGTPKHYWPSWVRARNAKQMPTKALLVQGSLIILFISAITWGNAYVTLLYNQLTMMTNISRALPYLLVALAYPAFKRKYRTQTELVPSSNFLPQFLSFSVVLTIAVSIFSQLYLPLIEKNYLQMFSLAIGPLFFSAIGAWLYQRFFRKRMVNQ